VPPTSRQGCQRTRSRYEFAQVDGSHDEVGLPSHRRLGIERDTEPGDGHHLQVVRPVAHRDRAVEGNAGCRGPLAQCCRFAGGIHDLALDETGQHAALDRKPVRAPLIDPERWGDDVEDLVESAGYDGGPPAAVVNGGDELGRSRGGLYARPHAVEGAQRDAAQLGHARAQTRREIHFTAHRRLGGRRDFGATAGLVGDELDDFVAQQSGVGVEHDEEAGVRHPSNLSAVSVRRRRSFPPP